MLRKFAILGGVGLAFLAAACSGSGDPPPAFADATESLEGRMAADLGAPVTFERQLGQTFVSARGLTRELVPTTGSVEVVREWLGNYATDLGMSRAPRILGEGTDGAGLRHVRLATNVPEGVEAPSVGWEVVLDSEGRLVYLLGRELADGAPEQKITEAEAIRIALAEATPAASLEPVEASPSDGASDAAEPATAFSPTASLMAWHGEDGASELAYRVTLEGEFIWIAATSRAVLARAPRASAFSQTTRAFSSHHYYQGARGIPGATKTIEVESDGGQYRLVRPANLGRSRIEVHSFAGFLSNGAFAPTTPLASSSLTEWDREKVPGVPDAISEGAGVDAAANAAATDQFFFRTIFRSPVRSGTIRVIVHQNRRSKNSTTAQDITEFDMADQSIHLSDGDYVGRQKKDAKAEVYDTLTSAVSVDIIAHELTHAALNRPSLPGMRGSFDEGLADVIGQFVEHEASPQAARPERAGEIANPGPDGIRNLAHPDRGTSQARAGDSHSPDHYDVRGCFVKGKLDPHAKDRWKCAHLNSTIVSHAWYLMTFGGKNSTSKEVVEHGVGWTLSEKLWTNLLGPQLTTANGSLQLNMVEDVETAARVQIAHARVLEVVAPGTLFSVACAWHAVGALSTETVSQLAGVTCRTALPRRCAGRPDGWYQDEVYEFSAIKCSRDATVDGHQCASIGMPADLAPRSYVPRTASGRFDDTLMLDAKTKRPLCVDPWNG